MVAEISQAFQTLPSAPALGASDTGSPSLLSSPCFILRKVLMLETLSALCVQVLLSLALPAAARQPPAQPLGVN